MSAKSTPQQVRKDLQGSRRVLGPCPPSPHRRRAQDPTTFPFLSFFSCFGDRRRERLLAERAWGKGFSVPHRRVLALGLQEKARRRVVKPSPRTGEPFPATAGEKRARAPCPARASTRAPWSSCSQALP